MSVIPVSKHLKATSLLLCIRLYVSYHPEKSAVSLAVNITEHPIWKKPWGILGQWFSFLAHHPFFYYYYCCCFQL